MANTALPRPSRILIVRLSAIGDVIHGVPVLCALRDALPEAFLGWVVEGRAGDLLEGHPALDELVRVPRGWLKSPREVWRLRRRLHELRFDTAIDLQCLTKSAIAAWLSGARRRIGKAGARRPRVEPLVSQRVGRSRRHARDRTLSRACCGRWGSSRRPCDSICRSGPTTRRWPTISCGRADLPPARFAILNPGAGWPSKVWPAERYGELARHLAKAHGMPSVAAWGVPSELPLAETIVATSGGHARLAPPTSMTELAALCRRAALFVGSDTGPMHLAVAVGTPTISLHGPSRADWCGAYGPTQHPLAGALRRGFGARTPPGRRLGDAGDRRGDGRRRLRPVDAQYGRATMRLVRQCRVGRVLRDPPTNSMSGGSRVTRPTLHERSFYHDSPLQYRSFRY